MTFEDGLQLVTAALAPRSLSELQIDVFRGTWNKHSYLKIALALNHKDGYIKDVGAELWQLLSQVLKIKVTKLNLREALAQYAQQRVCEQPALPQRRCVDWGEAPDVAQFYGRTAELTLLKDWVMQRCRLMAIVGIGGIGKTRLAARLAQQLVETDQFRVVVWRSLKQAPPLRELLAELMQTIAPEQSLPLRIDAMMRQLLEQLRYHRCLVILDGVEAVLDSGELTGTYRPGYEDYGWFFQQLGEGRHQSSVLLTSRETPREIAIQENSTAAVRLLRLSGLSIADAEAILTARGLTVHTERRQAQQLIEQYQGNPLALEIVTTPIKVVFGGNIAAFLAQETLLFKDIRDLLCDQFNRLSALEQQVMDWLAVNREAVTAAELQANFMPSVSQAQLYDALVSLDRRFLIEKAAPTLRGTIKLSSLEPTAPSKLTQVSYTQQPVVMEYVTERSIERICQDIEQAQMDCLRSHVLLKASTKDNMKDNVQDESPLQRQEHLNRDRLNRRISTLQVLGAIER